MENSIVVKVQFKDRKKYVFSPTTFTYETFLECGKNLHICNYIHIYKINTEIMSINVFFFDIVMFQVVCLLKLPGNLTFLQWIF